MTKNCIVCSGHSPILKDIPSSTESFFQHLAFSLPGERWCFDYVDISNDGSVIAQAIQQGEAIAVSDGSFQDQFGTASWVIEGSCPVGRIVGAVIVATGHSVAI